MVVFLQGDVEVCFRVFPGCNALAELFLAVFHGFHKLPNIWQYLSFFSGYICNYLDQ